MKTVGIDPSTSTGVAIVGEGEDRGKVIHIEDSTGFSRLGLMAVELDRTLEIWKPELVIVEAMAIGHHSSVVIVVQCATMVRQVLYNRKQPWFEVPPKTLKKWTTGNGNASKDDMAAFVKSRWNFVSSSDDINDAYALAQMGQLGVSALIAIKGVTLGI
jgi:crossover junction endodeoxyribonuclease RuvC